ncbi:5-formyltetrahydrofolate cyclo-ligase [hydrothermal vent metagenome]|uniref:5-formyltetrahydrofolate cyclo-ligase n=1 Tax=hydrothermal vent metagenome TaxID=652676 RepID=A0A3B0XJG6_9ZZZZ
MDSKTRQRQALRQALRKKRRSLNKATQKAHAKYLARQLLRCSLYKRSRHIGVYLAADGEIDPLPFIHKAWQQNKKTYLPVLAPFTASLYFAPYTPHSKMKLNRFQIAEPDVHPGCWLKPRQMQLILTPLVGFDIMGNRLGMGGGFYDRSLSFTRHRKSAHAPYLAGLAHQLQCVKQLPLQAHDIPMKMIVTEQRLYEIFSV